MELEHIRFQPAHRSWARRLVDSDLEPRRHLTEASPPATERRWRPTGKGEIHLTAVRADYARTMAEGGVERLLETPCPPLVRWRAPVLEVFHPRDADVLSAGARSRHRADGLLVAAGGAAAVLAGHGQGTGLGRAHDRRCHGRHCRLGRQRVRWPGARRPAGTPPAPQALKAVADGCSTTELARRLSISAAAASQHATVLRKANLITTSRDGKAVLHTVTSMGAALLNSAPN